MLTSQLTGGKTQNNSIFFSCDGLKELRMLILEKKIIEGLGCGDKETSLVFE